MVKMDKKFITGNLVISWRATPSIACFWRWSQRFVMRLKENTENTTRIQRPKLRVLNIHLVDLVHGVHSCQVTTVGLWWSGSLWRGVYHVEFSWYQGRGAVANPACISTCIWNCYQCLFCVQDDKGPRIRDVIVMEARGTRCKGWRGGVKLKGQTRWSQVGLPGGKWYGWPVKVIIWLWWKQSTKEKPLTSLGTWPQSGRGDRKSLSLRAEHKQEKW